jgi:hypothetical protein
MNLFYILLHILNFFIYITIKILLYFLFRRLDVYFFCFGLEILLVSLIFNFCLICLLVNILGNWLGELINVVKVRLRNLKHFIAA